ncbi:MAG TPA: flagellar biosynthesis protein FlhA [Candidatus Limenecus avicola]|jgi:flagellar biosynthesis protein flhA|uniref:Flagellar biosynthesis protein FlhA n=1 Tax=Candidatus Limenecus avicola TaxID=2840847 RepID=A0A9D1SRV3_9CLOT|nr:flagellar biosynthesis protein FlhA [Candidatus Limenecus avicola]
MNLGGLASLLKNNDILMAIGIVIIVVMMIIPLPPMMLDILLTLNISLSVIILLVCLFVKEPLEYSSFPIILLVATIFRLGLNVSSTRLILLNGSAGEVIHSFGQFVVGGNYIVGFIIFILLVVINFMVITGGATRVAEVSARFTLDSMPGKQLSIDADLNSGLINEEQAKARRRKLEREADFYGTMDGASKFVKGDATAGIIITVVNIFAGIVIGLWQLKMDIMTALSTFTILTVGDGLVSQLPALLISFSTGLIVSRASGQEESLSDDIKKEMFSNPMVLGIVSVLLFLLGMVPGMPTIPFLLVAASLGWMAFKKDKADKVQKVEEAKAAEEAKKEEAGLGKVAKKKKKATRESVMELLNVETIEMEIGYRLVPLLDVEQGGDLLERIAQIRRQTALDLGIVLPSIRVRDNLQLPPNTYQIKLKGVPIESGEVYPDRSLAMNAGGSDNDLGINGISAIEPAFGLPAIWVEEKDKEIAETYGYTVVSPSAVISTHLTEVIKKNSAEIVSRADIQQLIDNLKKEVSEEYVSDLMKDLTVAEVQQIVYNLLKERVSVRDLKTILEVLSLQSRVSKNADYLTEQVRQALSRSICKQNLADTGELLAVTLAPEVENTIAQGVSPDGSSLTLDPEFTRKLLDNLNYELERAISSSGNQPVLLCSSPIRLPFRRLIERTYPQIAVMSYNEISNNVKAKSIGVIRVTAANV